MKRLLMFLCALALSGDGVLRADENVLALQSKLKGGGFYFGAVNGAFDSETAAAVTRYQIRNGLPITSRVDAETAQSLGVAELAVGPAPGAEPWRRLRKPRENFLDQVKPRKPLDAPPDAPYTETFTLSRDRLRDFVAAFVLAGLDPQIDSELEFFADKVRYFGRKPIDRERIRKDLKRYNKRWPQRRFWLAGEIQVQPPRADGLLRITFPLRYELQRKSKQRSGTVQKTLELQIRGDDLEIVGVDEEKE